MNKKNVAILIFDDVEVLDFAGPFEVFSVTNELSKYTFFNVNTFSMKKTPITARNGLSVNPDYALSDVPKPDILIIPGGFGTRKLLHKHNLIGWIIHVSSSAEKVLSICTGAFLLAKAGLLKGLKATTHYSALETLAELAPDTEILKNQRFVDNGKIITSAGVSAGIDMSLYVIELLHGKETAQNTAKYIEYEQNE